MIKCRLCGKEYLAGKLGPCTPNDYPCKDCCKDIIARQSNREKICHHCHGDISDDPAVAEHELCDRCFDEIQDVDDLKEQWRKGE